MMTGPCGGLVTRPGCGPCDRLQDGGWGPEGGTKRDTLRQIPALSWSQEF